MERSSWGFGWCSQPEEACGVAGEAPQRGEIYPETVFLIELNHPPQPASELEGGGESTCVEGADGAGFGTTFGSRETMVRVALGTKESRDNVLSISLPLEEISILN